MKTKTNTAFTLVEIMIVVAIIGLLAAIAIPNFIQARNTSQANACITNLKQIQSAKASWATTNLSNLHPTALAIFGRVGLVPVCPAGGTYDIGAVGVDPLCPIPGHTLTLTDTPAGKGK